MTRPSSKLALLRSRSTLLIVSSLVSKFHRKYEYDHVGRVTQALSGQEARGGATTNDRP